MVVPFAPGGTGEFLSRSITPRMGELIGQQFIVDFRGGAGTTLAAGLVAAAPADGYTVLIQSLSTQAINHSLYANLSYDTRKDFAPVGLIGVIPLVLAAHPSLPARNAKELAALSHARTGSLNFGSAGIGTSAHFAVELFKLVSKADLTHIPYKGAGPAIIDAIAGFVPLVIGRHHVAQAAPRFRQAARHRHRQRAAFRGRAATGDVCRIGLSRIRGQYVVGYPGARADAGRHHCAPEQRIEQVTGRQCGAQPPADSRRYDQVGHTCAGDGIDDVRNRKVGEGG